MGLQILTKTGKKTSSTSSSAASSPSSQRSIDRMLHQEHYQFLTVKLIKREVTFRWLVPKGILVNWEDKRYRLDSLDKALQFYDNVIVLYEGQETREESEDQRQEELMDEERNAQQTGEEAERAIREGVRAKDQRQIRTLRKIKPIYK